ncbi:MAG TPA: hypothetical protein VNG51_28300 [Ktedonobacteraceae bacterium]|nr:hypothetical protein [Ktedonobacteraceae bacterium]
MSKGINIKGSKRITIENCGIVGYDTGLEAADSEDIKIDSTLFASKEALATYGPEFRDVFNVVLASKDKSAIAALTTIQGEPQPDKAVSEWGTLIRKFPIELESFAASKLPKVLSTIAYAILKAELLKYGIMLP